MKTTVKWHLSRRSLLVGTGLLLLGTSAFRLRSGTIDKADLIAKIVRRKADYVIIPESDLHHFAKDYAKNPNLRAKKLLKSKHINLLYSSAEPYWSYVFAEYQEQIEILERIVITDFLMATNYFSGETQPGKTLRYHGLQKGVCNNPFAEFS